MILASFFVCLAQHYLPTTTILPGTALPEGATDMTIRITAAKPEKDQPGSVDYAFTLTRAGDELRIASADMRPRQRDAPWLISTRYSGEHFRLTWDTRQNGRYAVLVGNRPLAEGKLVTLQSLTDAAFDCAKTGFDIALGLVAAMVLFLGLMRVGQDAGLVQLVARVLHPIIRRLFPDIPPDHPASGAILMNITTTLLGLGNAATPFGLKAMKELQDLNPHKNIASDSHVMLLGYNTAGFALLPVTLLALRKSAGCSDPFEIIGTCMVAGAVATVVAIIMVKVLGRLPLFTREAALAEEAREQAQAAAAANPAGGSR
jgi:spore maturation protein A